VRPAERRLDRGGPDVDPALSEPTRATRSRISRRDFLRQTAGVGVLLGGGALFPSPRRGEARGGRGRSERRTYFFDLSHIDTSSHDVVLVAGTQRVTLNRPQEHTLQRARREHPILHAVPDAHLTHYVPNVPMPAEAVQLCYLQRVRRGTTDGSWDMVLLFYHHPADHLLGARRRAQGMAGQDLPPVHVKWAQYGITPERLAALSDPVGEEMLQDTTSQAVALVAGHPELLAGDPSAAAHVQTNIIGTQQSTQVLGQVLARQGAATTSGGWATLTPLIDPDTGQPYTNSHGQNQYLPVWSQTTGQFAGQAIASALETAKDDRTLGVNITAIDPTTITTNDPSAPTRGAIWTLHDGRPAIDQSTGAAAAASGFAYQLTDQTPDHGYSVEVVGVDADLNVTIRVKNWFLRYLGVYIRYLDANGQPIPLSALAGTIQDKFPLWIHGQNGEFDAWLATVNPEFAVMGIPVETTTMTMTFPMPPAASSALILAGGFGRGDNFYPATVGPGKTVTVVVNLAVPALFLALAAAAGYATFVEGLQAATALNMIAQVIVLFFEELAIAIDYDAPVNWQAIAVQLAQRLLLASVRPLMVLIASSIATGETVEAVTDAIPVVGAILSAAFAVTLVAQIVETSAEVANSPQTYVDELTITHDVAVSIHHDPDDMAFPATAASYTVTAQFDNGTPRVISQPMPGTTVSSPITATFTNVPFGGQLTITVGFYSADGWLAGQGQIGPVPNAAGSCTTLNGSLQCQTTQTAGDLSLSLAITEKLVPLTAGTVYTHKEVIELETNGEHVWQPTTTPPSVLTPQGLCQNVNGQLCALDGITISTPNGAVGYAWQAYDQSVVDCASGATGQLHRFANLSIAQDPEDGRLFSGCGFSGPIRVVYDLLGTQDLNYYVDPTGNGNLIRQIRLAGGSPSFDGPASNKAWGRLKFSSDALLLHPLGKIVSINRELNKIEVLDLPSAAVPDDEAPQSLVYSGKGIREGHLLEPTLAVLAPDGTILILETGSNRIQAFDLSANPKRHFKTGQFFVPLVDPPDSGVTYLDLGIEYGGYFYVLSYTGQPGSYVYRLDLYTPAGDWLARTTGFNAARLAVNYWRDVYALNYQVLTLPDGTAPNITEPSVSHWIPSTP
jgi:hypothetical protein